MATDVQVPALGESITEGTLAQWLKKPGEAVAADEPIASLETDKVSVEVPSPVAGVLTEQLVKEGDNVAVGAVIERERRKERVKMCSHRLSISTRLKEAQNTAAMLTTFNGADMTAVNEARTRYKDLFEKKHGIRLGFMGFFVKAFALAAKDVPSVNASLEGDEIVYHDYLDVSVAVSAPKGLVVPVVRDADKMSFAEIEKTIAEYGKKAKEGTLTADEMTGGTFTISNGGVFGSLLSTPIINPPQSAVLGMHRKPRDARRHLPQRWLHSVQGFAPRVGAVRGSGPRDARQMGDQDRRSRTRPRHHARLPQGSREGAHAGRRVPVQEEQGRMAQRPSHFSKRRHGQGRRPQRPRQEHCHRHRLVGHAAAGGHHRPGADRRFDRRAGVAAGPEAHGRDRGRGDRARARL